MLIGRSKKRHCKLYSSDKESGSDLELCIQEILLPCVLGIHINQPIAQFRECIKFFQMYSLGSRNSLALQGEYP